MSANKKNISKEKLMFKGIPVRVLLHGWRPSYMALKEINSSDLTRLIRNKDKDMNNFIVDFMKTNYYNIINKTKIEKKSKITLDYNSILEDLKAKVDINEE